MQGGEVATHRAHNPEITGSNPVPATKYKIMKHRVERGIGVYITHTCNLNCTDCNTFNNFSFSGHQRWSDYQALYTEWSKRIDTYTFFIIGGEPMTNPDFLSWVHGIAGLWPDSEIKITTNGTQFKRWPTLYQELLPYRGRVRLFISVHNEDSIQHYVDIAREFLQGDISEYTDRAFDEFHWQRSYNRIRGSDWPDCNSIEEYQNLPEHIKQECEQVHNIKIQDFVEQAEITPGSRIFIDSNHVRLSFSLNDKFASSSVRLDNNQLSLYNSDPNKAISACYLKACHRFYKGKLYKCPVVPVLPDFAEQFSLPLSDSDQKLINSYRAGEADWDDVQLAELIDNFEKETVIDQCKFCPEQLKTVTIKSSAKKIKIHNTTPRRL